MTKNRRNSIVDLRHFFTIGKKLPALLILCYVLLHELIAGEVKSDSLLILVSDSLKAETMLKTAQEKFFSNTIEALEFGKKSNFIFKKINNTKGIGRSSNLVGACYFSQGNYSVARDYFQNALSFASLANDTLYIGRSLNNLGNVYIKTGVLDKALDCLIRAKHLYKSKGNLTQAIAINNNIGELYRTIGCYRKALDYFQESLSMAESEGNDMEKATIYHNISAVYTELEEYDKALSATENSFELRKKTGFKIGMIKNFISFGNIYQLQGENSKALDYYKQGLALAHEVGSKDDEATLLLHLGYIDLKNNKFDSAEKNFTKSLTLAKELGNSETCAELYNYLYIVDSLKGNYVAASQYNSEYHSLQDKIDRFNPDEKIRELESKYALAKNEIRLQSAELDGKRKTLFYISFGALNLVALLILCIQFIRIRSKKRTSELMQENLRSQINPHFIFNVLNSINAYILQNDKEASSAYLLKFARLLRLVLDNAQNNLVTINDEVESLRLYLELEAMRLNNKIEYEIYIDDEIDPQMFKIPALILQPYVENSILHGLQNKKGGGKVAIKLEYLNNTIHCSVSDNGIGRKKSQEKKQQLQTSHKSYGTKITENRLRLLNTFYGKKLGIRYSDLNETNPEMSGTKVEFDIPVMS